MQESISDLLNDAKYNLCAEVDTVFFLNIFAKSIYTSNVYHRVGILSKQLLDMDCDIFP